MKNATIAEGIRLFAERTGAKLNRMDELMFEATFSNETYPDFIGIEMFGMVLSYCTYCGVIPNVSWAPVLLKKNWGGVKDTCFYFSVHFQDREPWLVLETRQSLSSTSTAEDIASCLAALRQQLCQAKRALPEERDTE